MEGDRIERVVDIILPPRGNNLPPRGTMNSSIETGRHRKRSHPHEAVAALDTEVEEAKNSTVIVVKAIIAVDAVVAVEIPINNHMTTIWSTIDATSRIIHEVVPTTTNT
jgi:hypothetical protein